MIIRSDGSSNTVGFVGCWHSIEPQIQNDAKRELSSYLHLLSGSTLALSYGLFFSFKKNSMSLSSELVKH